MSRGDGWSVAATLIATGIGYFVGGPKAAWGCLIVGLLIALILHFTRPRKELGTLPAALPSVKDSFNPEFKQETSPTQTQNMTGVKFETHYHGTSSRSPAPPAPPRVSPPKNRPNMRCLGPTDLIIRQGLDGHGFYEGTNDDGVPGSIVCFRNESSEQREVPTAYRVRAALSFFNEAGAEIGNGISEGCWFGDHQHVDFELHESHCVVVLLVRRGEFVCPYLRSVSAHWGKGWVIEGEVLRETPKTVEVRLLGRNELFLPPCVFDIAVEKGRVLLTRRPSQ